MADGVTLWNGSQLAIDTTLVSPLHRDGTARRRAADHNGVALEHARHRKTATYPELTGEVVAPDWSFWTQRWVDGSPLKLRLS